jgi:hypothetical protein
MATDHRITREVLDYFYRFIWPEPALLREDIRDSDQWIVDWYQDARRVAAGSAPVRYLLGDVTDSLLLRAIDVVAAYYTDDALAELLDDGDGDVSEGIAVARAIALARAGKYTSLDGRPALDPIANALHRAVIRIRQDQSRRDREDLERRQAERVPHERAVLLAPRETLESVILGIAGALDTPEWDSSTTSDVYAQLNRACFAPPALTEDSYDGSYVEDHCDECGESEPEGVCDPDATPQTVSTLKISLVVDGDSAEARRVLNKVLDQGVLQDAIADYPNEGAPISVVAVEVEVEAETPDVNDDAQERT